MKLRNVLLRHFVEVIFSGRFLRASTGASTEHLNYYGHHYERFPRGDDGAAPRSR